MLKQSRVYKKNGPTPTPHLKITSYNFQPPNLAEVYAELRLEEKDEEERRLQRVAVKRGLRKEKRERRLLRVMQRELEGHNILNILL